QLDQGPDCTRGQRENDARNQPPVEKISALDRRDCANNQNQEPQKKNQRDFLQTAEPARHSDSHPPCRLLACKLCEDDCERREKCQANIQKTAARLCRKQRATNQNRNAEWNYPRPIPCNHASEVSKRDGSENAVQQRPNSHCESTVFETL